jgi:hypothetical protein
VGPPEGGYAYAPGGAGDCCSGGSGGCEGFGGVDMT